MAALINVDIVTLRYHDIIIKVGRKFREGEFIKGVPIYGDSRRGIFRKLIIVLLFLCVCTFCLH